MVITKDVHLPSEEDLTVDEVPISTPYLRAAAFHYGKYCENQNNEFMLCRSELKDPRKCLVEGKAVTACAMSFFRAMKATCASEFTQYATCVDKSSSNCEFDRCRKTQAVFDQCMLDKMNIERPEYGYYCRVKIHDSPRPRPEPEKPTLYPDATPGLPEDYPRPPAKYGSRFHFLN